MKNRLFCAALAALAAWTLCVPAWAETTTFEISADRLLVEEGSGGSARADGGWEKLSAKLKEAEDGDTLTATLKADGRLPVAVIHALRDRDVTLRLSLPGGEALSINGKRLKSDGKLRLFYTPEALAALYGEEAA